MVVRVQRNLADRWTARSAFGDLGLDDLRGFLKYGNHVARFSFPFIALEEKSPGFDERKMDDLIVPNTPLPAEPKEMQGNLLFPAQELKPAAQEME